MGVAFVMVYVDGKHSTDLIEAAMTFTGVYAHVFSKEIATVALGKKRLGWRWRCHVGKLEVELHVQASSSRNHLVLLPIGVAGSFVIRLFEGVPSVTDFLMCTAGRSLYLSVADRIADCARALL